MATFEMDLFSWEVFEGFRYDYHSRMTDLERAHRFYYLIMAGWGGELALPRLQTAISDGGHGNRLIGAIKHLRSKIMPVHERLQTVIIEHLDWREFMERYDRKGVFMYVDPPYPGNHCNYAHNMRSIEEHRALVDRLRQAECRWLLTSFDKPEVRRLYDEFQVTPIDFASGLVAGDGSRRNREIRGYELHGQPDSRPADAPGLTRRLPRPIGKEVHCGTF